MIINVNYQIGRRRFQATRLSLQDVRDALPEPPDTGPVDVVSPGFGVHNRDVLSDTIANNPGAVVANADSRLSGWRDNRCPHFSFAGATHSFSLVDRPLVRNSAEQDYVAW